METAILVSTIGALASVIGWMGKNMYQKLDDCETDRKALWAALADKAAPGESVADLQQHYRKGGDRA